MVWPDNGSVDGPDAYDLIGVLLLARLGGDSKRRAERQTSTSAEKLATR
jgi:hypothetical protein